MMRFRTFVRGLVAVMAVAALGLCTGCEGDGGGDGGGSSSVVGRWQLTNSGGETTWWQFNEDGTFVMYNDSGFASKHLWGTFSQDGSKVKGPFTNPGVGEGEIDATVSEDGKSLNLDFIEHWHSPYKHVPHSGPKL